MKYLILVLFSLLVACATQSPPAEVQITTVPLTLPELSWEKNHPERKAWSEALLKEIDGNYSKLSQAQDLKDFCPKSLLLSKSDLTQVLAEIFVAMSLYESSWNPSTQYTESSMGIDKITGKQVVSEGLFQLSYQDGQWYPKCKFDYPKKDILLPGPNITCAVSIMANQVEKKKAFKVSSGAYWSVLKLGSKYNKITEIQSRTKNLGVCK